MITGAGRGMGTEFASRTAEQRQQVESFIAFLSSQPGTIPAGLVSDELAMNIDFLPTIMAWTGKPLPTPIWRNAITC